MKWNKILLSMVSMTVLLLVACNNNNDQALNNNNKVNEDDTISSLSTDSNSDNYPHTQPIKIQDAKYEFKTIVGKDGQTNQQQNQKNPAQEQGTQQQNGGGQANNNSQQQQQQQAPQQQQQNQAEAPGNNQATPDSNGVIQSVVELTNAERQKQGLPPLKADAKLNEVADEKAKDMHNKGYFSHTSPTYGSPFDMMRDFGVSYQSAAENIAQGQQSPEEVVKAWMNSEGHRRNILDERFTHIGVGFEQGGNQWVQMLIKK